MSHMKHLASEVRHEDVCISVQTHMKHLECQMFDPRKDRHVLDFPLPPKYSTTCQAHQAFNAFHLLAFQNEFTDTLQPGVFPGPTP